MMPSRGASSAVASNSNCSGSQWRYSASSARGSAEAIVARRHRQPFGTQRPPALRYFRFTALQGPDVRSPHAPVLCVLQPGMVEGLAINRLRVFRQMVAHRLRQLGIGVIGHGCRSVNRGDLGYARSRTRSLDRDAGAGGVIGDRVGHAAEEKSASVAETAAAEDDHVDIFAGGNLEDLIGRLTLDRASDDVALASVAGARLSGAGEMVAQGPGEVVAAYFFLHRHVFGLGKCPQRF